MTYIFPDNLAVLRTWLKSHHLDVTSLKSERQATFMAQQLAGTRFKFPEQGKSCRHVLEAIQSALPENTAAVPVRKLKGKARKIANGNKAHKTPLMPTETDRGLVIYADGACDPNPGAGGWGFVVYRDGVEIHADCGGAEPATNQTMELTAAIMALRWFAERGIIEPVRLLSDSRYVVNGSNDWRHSWKAKGWKRGGPNAKPENAAIANLDLWKELDAALTAVPIQLEWCKGHAGIIGNERADELSLEGKESILALQPEPMDLIEQQLDYSARGGW